MSIFLGCLNVFHSIPAALENLGQRCSLLAHSIGKWQIEKWQKLQETADVSDVSASIFSFDHCARLRCTKYGNMLHSTMNEESTRSTRSARKKIPGVLAELSKQVGSCGCCGFWLFLGRAKTKGDLARSVPQLNWWNGTYDGQWGYITKMLARNKPI